MQPSNVRRIVVEDFKQDDREAVAKLAEIVNPFMEEVVDILQGKVGIDNLTRNYVKIDITVDALGKPLGVNQIQTGLQSYTGKVILDVQNLSGGDNVISTPYLDCTYVGNGLVKVNKFTGLPVGKKLRITIEFHA